MPSNVFSEERSHRMHLLIQQLECIQHLVESGFWLSTHELELLLNLEPSFVEHLQSLVKSQQINAKVSWRNLNVCLVDCQFSEGFWTIKERQTTKLPTKLHSSPSVISTLDIPTSNFIHPSAQSEIIPSPYALIENFLTPQQLNDLLHYSIRKQSEFLPTTNSANDPNYRRSFYLNYFPEFSELITALVRKLAPQIIAHLEIANFAIGQIESQLTAHNHGNFYKIHNDNGSPDSANRVLTYVYYFHREPKAFTGGELLLYDGKNENGYLVAAPSHKVIQPTNNTIVFFPSQYMHEVLPVHCPSEYFADSRFTVNGWLRRV
ncbi:MAG: 2OG-Fe(II) oxygenase [Pseudanabaenaceae cyanobacterium bins.39]|nr:2OG-Fe(II) oxygenase [Pseudanabaenaceae cyanobacterium bins.39]